ncbi:MAG: hypothetical protein JSR67_03855 [Proteobacteria bacterium]|nr:hypothetical protein [Pseudomonadota bacterium]
MTFDSDTTEAHERRITRCKSCRARIVWLTTEAGKKIPVDADTVEADDEIYEHGRHVSHFGTCPQASSWRKPR